MPNSGAPSGSRRGRDAPQASLSAHAGGSGVLADQLAKVRALAAPPADAASWVRCEELQDELKAVLAGWRAWPKDGRCDESVRALTLLLAAVDAAPVGFEVFFPLEGRDEWDTRLLGPAVVPAGGRKRGLNSEMHAAIWGAEFVRSPDNNDRAPVQPDDLIKWIGAGAISYWLNFPAKLEPGSELEYEAMTQSYVLFCRMGVAVKQPHNAAALGARLRQLRSPLTVEALEHLIHQQKTFQAVQMFQHPWERQHNMLQLVAQTSCMLHMLALRPASLRSAAIAASTSIGLNQPAVALKYVQAALGTAEHLARIGQRVPDEPYHRVLLHLAAARALVQGGGGGRVIQVAEVQAHLDAAKAAKAACREWLPTMLKAAAKQTRLQVPLTDEQLAAAVQAGRTALPVQPPLAPAGALAAAGIPQPMQRARDNHSGECDCPNCRAKVMSQCSGCGNMVSTLKSCSQCRTVAYCSRECQKRHWKDAHKSECAQLAERGQRPARRG